jgi:hypothetical protein
MDGFLDIWLMFYFVFYILGKVPSFGVFVHYQWGFSRGKLMVVSFGKRKGIMMVLQ